MAKVELACGDYRVVSLMSREAADDMGLAARRPRHGGGEVDERDGRVGR